MTEAIIGTVTGCRLTLAYKDGLGSEARLRVLVQVAIDGRAPMQFSLRPDGIFSDAALAHEYGTASDEGLKIGGPIQFTAGENGNVSALLPLQSGATRRIERMNDLCRIAL